MTLSEFWNIFSALATGVSFIFVCLTIYWTIRGLIPPLVRLGYGLRRNRIVILSKEQAGAELKRLIEGSSLFNEKRIEIADPENEIEVVVSADVILVHWEDCQNDIDRILDRKNPNSALIVYAPPPSRLSAGAMDLLSKRKHVVLCNFRGRLMNDILTTMMYASGLPALPDLHCVRYAQI